ncbi:FAST kinase domain-containing protein 1, mitochondrial-like isoform X2 [Anneissia japonica]|uniref:FAST kinase domain-containing protein 1, mitochondrial-like isoform X2 n=1 Tax=Anneissia japonica TaxID=1529436 RepID=UPI0014257A14|nr:FAST kinase domain-containing protein 1, mitochondrial-like isoform X2 [Anneissia japonica]
MMMKLQTRIEFDQMSFTKMASLFSRQYGQMLKGHVMNNVSACVANISLMNQINYKKILLCHPVSCHTDSLSYKQSESRYSATKFHKPLTTNEAVLLKEIESNGDIDSLFALLRTKRSWLTTAHIGAAMINLLGQQKLIVDEHVDQTRNYVRLHPEFNGLCILAENKVRDMDNSTLVNTLYALLKFMSDRPHSLVTEMICEVDRRLSTFTINELAIFAACSQDTLDPKSVLLGKVTECFHIFIQEEPMDVRDAATILRATVGVTSYKFRKQIYKRLLNLFVEHQNEISTNDLRKILQSISISGERPKQLLQECCSLLQLRLKSLSIWELSTIYHSLDGFYDENLQNDIVEQMENKLPACKNASELINVITVLAPTASPQLKFQLEELANAALPKASIFDLGNLCVALRLMGFRVPSHLISSIADKFEKNSDHVQFTTLLKVVEFFQNTRLPLDDPFFKFLEIKVLSFYQTAISPLRMLGITYLLSLLPIKNLDPDIITRLDKMIHQYNVASINQLFLALTRISKKLDKSINDNIGISNLLQKSNMQAVEKISDVTSVVYLNNMIHHMLDEGYNSNSLLISTVMEHYSKCLHRLTPQLAVECSRSVIKTRFLQIKLLDAIADITSKSMFKVSPREVLSLLSPYCILNYRPQNTPDFFNICLRRFIPFMDHVPSIFLLDIAYLLSLVEIFPEDLLKKLFNLQVLIKLEEEVEARPKRIMYRQRLMQLNRALVIECSHLQVPWFHEDYCLEILKARRMHFPKVLKSLQSCLSVILGGPQFFRSFVLSPYFYEIDFECILDGSGNPLPCADYGSVLNRSGQVTSNVLSDLMQWGTQTKQLPEGAQRIAIDFLSKSQFCLNSRHPTSMVAVKKRHLESMGYKYIQIPHYVWDSLTLSEHDDEVSYLRDLIFNKDSTLSPVAQRHSQLVERDQHGSVSKGSVEEEAVIIKLLHLLDRVS